MSSFESFSEETSMSSSEELTCECGEFTDCVTVCGCPICYDCHNQFELDDFWDGCPVCGDKKLSYNHMRKSLSKEYQKVLTLIKRTRTITKSKLEKISPDNADEYEHYERRKIVCGEFLYRCFEFFMYKETRIDFEKRFIEMYLERIQNNFVLNHGKLLEKYKA